MKKIYLKIVLVLVFLVLFFSAVKIDADALATTRYVASTGIDTGNCSIAGLPCRSIQYAVNHASSGDTILVAKGTYTYNPVVDPCSFLPSGGVSVVCIVDKTLNIIGGYSTSNWIVPNPTTNLTLIDGQNTYRGVYFLGYNITTASLDMEGFTIRNGRADGPATPGDPNAFGGGMFVGGARVTLRDMIFENNEVNGQDTSSGAGGTGAGSGLAINWSQSGTSNLLERVTFEGNQSYGGNGPERGGLAYGALFVNASVTINGGTFLNNQAIAADSTGSGLSGGLFADALGGAIGGGKGTWALNNITAMGNQVVGGDGTTYAGGGYGGGIYIELGTWFSISDSYLSNNLAQGGDASNGGFGAGGGILVNTTPATIDRVSMIANSAIGGNSTSSGNAGGGGGGGLYLWRTDNSAVNATVTNAIIADNYVAMGSVGGTALGGGGGGAQVQGQVVTFSHTTFARNRFGPSLVSGQGLLVLASPGVSSATANVNYCIVADHTEGATNAAAVVVQEGNTANFNLGLFSGNARDTNAGGVPTPVGTITGLTTMLSAPLAGFRSSGSPDYDYHILQDSPAVDQATGSSLTIDIDQQIRPVGEAADIGADEYQVLVFLPLVIR